MVTVQSLTWPIHKKFMKICSTCFNSGWYFQDFIKKQLTLVHKLVPTKIIIYLNDFFNKKSGLKNINRVPYFSTLCANCVTTKSTKCSLFLTFRDYVTQSWGGRSTLCMPNSALHFSGYTLLWTRCTLINCNTIYSKMMQHLCFKWSLSNCTFNQI